MVHDAYWVKIRFLICIFFALPCYSVGQTISTDAQIPQSGREVPELKIFDEIMADILSVTEAPGGFLGFVYKERLVYARGFGYADTNSKEIVQPTSLFRIASVSKPITAAAILKLVEQGKLSLDHKIYDFFEFPSLRKNQPDPRIKEISIKHLLTHTGGWDRNNTYDPMFFPVTIAVALGVTPPAPPRAIIRYMFDRPLDFDPGTQQVYSNLGYSILGRIIEEVSGETYEHFIRQEILDPAGAHQTQLGKSRLQHSLENEVHYHDPRELPSVFPGGGVVHAPYGAFSLESMDAHGGWVSSGTNLLKFLTMIDGNTKRKDILKQKFIGLMRERPNTSIDSLNYYGAGMEVRFYDDRKVLLHLGDLPGTTALIMQIGDAGAVLLLNGNAGSFENLNSIIRRLIDTITEIDNWPEHDFFTEY